MIVKIQQILLISLFWGLCSHLAAQPLTKDTTFQPFFDMHSLPRYQIGSIRKVWENPRNGNLWIVGEFNMPVFYNGKWEYDGGITSMNNDGSRNNAFLPFPASGNGKNLIPVKDSILYFFSSGGILISTIGFPSSNWIKNIQKTLRCERTVEQPYFFKDGSSLWGQWYPNPRFRCNIINPPDTFPHRFLVKVTSDGLWDSTFQHEIDGPLLGFLPYDSNRIWLFGNPQHFSLYDTIAINGWCRIYEDGRLDTSFHNPLSASNRAIQMETVDNNGKFLLSGVYFLKNDTKTYSLARFHADGSIDTTFNTNGPTYNSSYPVINTVCPTPDGGYLVGGIFNQYQGHKVNNIAKIDSNGNIEPRYFTSAGPDSANYMPGGGYYSPAIYTIISSNNGGYFVAGDFLKWDNKKSQPIIRLKELGTVGIGEKEIPSLSVNIYPNPTKEVLKVNCEENIAEIKVFDLLGKEQKIPIKQQSNKGYELNTKGMSNGVFLLQLKSTKNINFTTKFIKQ